MGAFIVVVMLLGLALIGVGVYFGRAVVAHERKWINETRAMLWHTGEVRFETDESEKVSVPTQRKLELRETAKVQYDPENPEDCSESEPLRQKFFVLGALLGGIICVMISIVAGVLTMV